MKHIINKTKVSILVPVYNVEKYLDQCLNSLKNQTLKDIEIICINDGSTDNSLNIIKKYLEKDERFLVIDKKNTGYGDSMNRGLDIAKGKYIGIVEPDDFIELNAFEKLYHIADKTEADIIRANYYHYAKGKDQKKSYITPDIAKKITNAKNTPELFMHPPAIWSAIYRRDFIKNWNIAFLPTPGASYQDTGFYFKTLISAQKIFLLEDAFLHYRIDNANSSVKSNKKVFEIITEHQSIQEFIEVNKMDIFYLQIMQPAKFANYLWNIKRLPWRSAKKFIHKIRPEFIKSNKEGLINKKFFSFKHWIVLRMLLIIY